MLTGFGVATPDAFTDELFERDGVSFRPLFRGNFVSKNSAAKFLPSGENWASDRKPEFT
jgi:hypothetical protein